MSILEAIRRRTREEWLDVFRDKLTDLRIWVQEHPEKAFFIGIILGAVIVLFFKIVFWLLFIIVVALVAGYFYALPAQRNGRAADYIVREEPKAPKSGPTDGSV